VLTKLTLTIEQSIIKKAKKYAHRKKKSVSKIVEEYLRSVSGERDNFNLKDHEINAPITESLVGMFKDSGKDYKDMLAEARIEKYS
jgi:hypothetical protein